MDECLVKIDQEAFAAPEAGYTGERNVTTWREHFRMLEDLGLIGFEAASCTTFPIASSSTERSSLPHPFSAS